MTLPLTTAQRVESPCTKVCVLDAARVCVGCGRTLDEIAAWSRLKPEQQHAICLKAAERLSAASARASNS